MTESLIEVKGFLKPDTPFNKIFPTGIVPLLSSNEILPNRDDAPRCYVIDATKLSENQITLLARQVYFHWTAYCETLADAIAYVKKGLPLNVIWFTAIELDHIVSS